MKKIAGLALLIIHLNLAAQNCDPEALKTQPGKWLPQPKDAITGEPNKPAAADIAGAKKILIQIQQLFQKEYKPVGADAYHYFHFMNNNKGNSTYGNEYTYSIRNFALLCVNGKNKPIRKQPVLLYM